VNYHLLWLHNKIHLKKNCLKFVFLIIKENKYQQRKNPCCSRAAAVAAAAARTATVAAADKSRALKQRTERASERVRGCRAEEEIGEAGFGKRGRVRMGGHE
jgi:hypothetical protein